MKVVLDTNVLGKLCHPTNKKNRAFIESLVPILESGNIEIFLPEIADYELRRKILQKCASDINWKISLSRLDALKETLSYLPIEPEFFLQAAQNWEDAKNSGQQAAHDDALDGDVILAAQALSIGGKVVTENEKHLSVFCEVLLPQKFIEEATKTLRTKELI